MSDFRRKIGDADLVIPNGVEKAGNTADSSRRRLIQAALIAPPIAATLVAQPVQAVQGLSHMHSGSMSACRGDVYHGGRGPGIWKRPDRKAAWSQAAMHYGNQIHPEDEDELDEDGHPIDGSRWKHYTGGTTFLACFGDGDDVPCRVILNDSQYSSTKRHLLAGLLNCRYSDRVGGSRYFMKESDLLAMYHGHKPLPPGYGSLKNLIKNHYNEEAGSNCEDA